MSVADELQRLHLLHQSGSLDDEEFSLAKARLLRGPQAVSATTGDAPPARDDSEEETRQWAMFLHLSLLSGIVVPLGGLVVPIVLWQVKKQELPDIDAHGRVVMNWRLSYAIYMVVSIALSFVIIGIPLVIALGIVGIVFPILGGIKASKGELWIYPLSITFLKAAPA